MSEAAPSASVSRPPPPLPTTSSSSSSSSSTDVYLALASFLRLDSEHLKLALCVRHAHLAAAAAAGARVAGEEPEEHRRRRGRAHAAAADRYLALVSNVENGWEESALLLLRRRTRQPRKLRAVGAVPLLPGFKGRKIERRQSSSTAETDVEGRVDPADGGQQSEREQEVGFTLAYGDEAIEAYTRDVQGLDDLLLISQQLADAADSRRAEQVAAKSHRWLANYLVQPPLEPLGTTPIFSRFSTGASASLAQQRGATDAGEKSRLRIEGESGGGGGRGAEERRPSSPTAEELSVFVTTFNVNGQTPEELGDLGGWLTCFPRPATRAETASSREGGGAGHGDDGGGGVSESANPAAAGGANAAGAAASAVGASSRFALWNAPTPPALEGLAPDVLAVSLQEVASGTTAYLYRSPDSVEAWRVAVEAQMGRRRGEYVLLAARQLVGITLLVFVRRVLYHQVHALAETHVGVGLGGFIGNKGACCVRFELGGRSYCFVASHLSAYEGPEALERRRWDYNEIVRRARFSLGGGGGGAAGAGVGGGDSGNGAVQSGQGVRARTADADTDTDADAATQTSESDASTLRTYVGDGVASLVEDAKASLAGATTDADVGAPGAVGSEGGSEKERWRSSTATGTSTTTQPPPPPQQQSVSILDHDVCFWAGDLNFRLLLGPTNFSEVKRMLARASSAATAAATAPADSAREAEAGQVARAASSGYEELLAFDELRAELQTHRDGNGSFVGWNEAEIRFPCTYKYVRGGTDYDPKRNPAWTDRVLWRERPRDAVGPGADGPEKLVRCDLYTASLLGEPFTQDPAPRGGFAGGGAGDGKGGAGYEVRSQGQHAPRHHHHHPFHRHASPSAADSSSSAASHTSATTAVRSDGTDGVDDAASPHAHAVPKLAPTRRNTAPPAPAPPPRRPLRGPTPRPPPNSDHRPVCASFSVRVERGSVRWSFDDDENGGDKREVGGLQA